MAKYPGTVKSALQAVRRTLKKAGLPLGKTVGTYQPFGRGQTTIEGFAITRVGVSSTVALHYKEADPGTYDSEKNRRTRQKEADARDLLRSKGFPFDDRGWMECEYE
jgi:hypothetical protein